MRKPFIHSILVCGLMFCVLTSLSCSGNRSPSTAAAAETQTAAASTTCDAKTGNSDKTVVVTCPAHVDKLQVCVSGGFSVIWVLPESTPVQIGSFKQKDTSGNWSIEADPIESWSSNTGGPHQLRGLVKDNASGSYKYTVACSKTDILDPVIDVPPRSRS